ncbi:MAG TPA: isopeptide-forming domain-containing fimbrial protein, partial [Microbacteriaceae bacterium]|nr:isopeptide-forming domain-containing fimbrial protein [Microbacteriaceae bacterium]
MLGFRAAKRRRGRHAKPSSWSSPYRLVAAVLAPVLALAGIGTGVLLSPSFAAADDGSTPVTSVTSVGSAGKNFILAGENATYDIAVTNNSGSPKYNLSVTALVPAGVSFVSASFLGTPTEYLPGTPLPNATRALGPAPATDCPAPLVPVGPSSRLCTAPAGYALWVWQNVSDLPDTATVTSSLEVMPSAAAFPVGTDDLGITITSYTSNNPTLLAAFDGSTSVASNSNHTSLPGTASASTEVRALRVTKSEPSPEQELLRGVHNNTTTYTIVVENTGEDATNGVTVTDYIPAGLEYLGIGREDNTVLNPAPYLFDDDTREYPGAASLAGTPAPTDGPGDVPGPGWNGIGETVETVSLDATQATALGLAGAGVYTKVTWTIGTLSDGTAQAFSTIEGTPGEYTIRYRAAVPLFENTMDWPGATPAINGEQGSNLGNNTGASTRHGLDAGDYDYAQAMTNTVAVVGTYSGDVDDESDRSSSDDDSVTIEAVDLRVIKSVDIDAFATGQLATYRLDLATSEYTSAAGIALTDDIANGLCPAFPAQPTEPTLLVNGSAVGLAAWNVAVGPDCAYPNPSGTVIGATVTSIGFTTSDGSFEVVFAADPMAAQATAVIEYTALQRQVYIPDTPSAPRNGATSSGDTMVNHVEVTGTTTAIPALTDNAVESGSGAPAYGDETVADDSTAEIHSHFSGLTKKVLARDKNPDQSEPNASNDGDWTADDYGDWVDHAAQPFALGDTVWYRVRVDFPDDIETRQPKLTDFLPQGVEYVGTTYEAQLGSIDPSDFGDFIPAPTVNGSVLTWDLGAQLYLPQSSDRFIPIGSWIEFTIEGRVIGQSASASEVDKPENQAKYQQQNVEGDVFFLRDDASVDLDYGASMVAKGIRDVNGVSTLPAQSQAGPDGEVFGSNRDGITVRQDDVVTYRLDLTAPETDLTDLVVWDALPSGILKADVGNFTAATAAKVGLGAWSETTLPTGFTATAYDWVDLSPTEQAQINPAMAGRSVIKWEVSARIAGSDRDSDPALDTIRGLTLGYDVTVPDGNNPAGGPEAEITQDYVNDASITNYAVVNNWTGMNSDGTSTLVPEPGEAGQVSVIEPDTDEFEVPSTGTYDPSNVGLPNATMVKDRISTEIAPSGTTVTDPNNGAGQIVQGETVTFRYAVTIPANTSVSNGVLADDGMLRWTGAPTPPNDRQIAYELLDSTAPVPAFLLVNGPDWADSGFAFDPLTATLTFPALYQNDTVADQVFTVEVTVWVEDRDEFTPGYNPNFPNSKTLTNTARYGFDNPDAAGRLTVSDTADVVYVEPVPTLAKTVVGGTVGADGDVTFQLTAGNTGGRPALYDAVVYDCLPAGFDLIAPNYTASQGSATDPGIACTVTGTGADQRVVQGSGTGTLIVWTVGRLNGGASATLQFTAKLDPDAGGGASYTNRAHIVGYTLPSTLPDDPTTRRGDRATGAEREVELLPATIDKSVTTPNGLGSAPVGETVRYTLVVNLPANANFYDVTLTDTLPTGVTYAGDQVISYSGWPANPTVTGPVDPNSQNLSWTIAPADIPLHTSARTITIAFDATITTGVGAATSVTNSAEFAWNVVDGDAGSRLDDDDDAVVTILNPLLGIAKDVKFSEEADTAYRQQAQGGPDRDLTYRVRVTNTGNTPAYNATVTDAVPAGVVVDASSISGGGVLTGNDLTTGGGTISWTIAGPIAVGAGNAVTFTYDAVFAPSANLGSTTNGQGDVLTNTARVTHYESFPRDPLAPSVVTGREYNPTTVQDTAEARALFPHVTLTKAVADTSHTAYVGEPFDWVLTATNSGQGDAQKVVLTDTLPDNWTFTAVTSITVAGATVASTNPTGPAGGPLVWTFGADAVAGSPVAILAPGQSIVIRYTATPTDPDAITNPGVGSSNPHVNTLSAVTTDPQNATSNATRSHTGPDATDNAFLREADLFLLKEAIGGVVDSGTGQADNLHGLPTGSWVPGQAAVSGDYAQPQWRITVTNQGPDASFGPFTFEDTTTLPTGVTTGAFSARYYSSSGDTTGTALTLTGTGTSVDPFVVGSTTTSLAATGADRIVLIANVTIGAGATADATQLHNIADVAGRTYEDPNNFDDNEDEVGKPLTPVADLSIDKVVTSPVPPVAPVVGSTITWQITARNLGPSVSVSTLADPITI